MNKPVHHVVVTLSFAASLMLAGCQPSEEVDPTALRMRVLASQYMRYTTFHRGQAPQSDSELRKFVADRGDAVLQEAGVDSVDELFKSERDEQPLVILYGKNTLWHNDLEVFAYESQGSGNRFMIGYRVGETELLDEETLNELKKKRRI